MPSGEIDADDVHALLDDALAQIRVAAEAIGITERATFEQRVTSIAATGVFLVVIDVNRQLNHMLRVPISDAEVFEEVSSAITYAASLLSTYPGTTPVPEQPPFDGYKRPADVYQRLTECLDAVIRVAPKIGVSVLGLSLRRNVPDDTEPGHACDIARFLVADLAAFADTRDAPLMRAPLPAPKHIFPTEVYARAGILFETARGARAKTVNARGRRQGRCGVDAGPRAYLLVTKAVGGPVELPDVERARLRSAEAARHDDAIAGLERIARHADVGELEAIVHLEPPPLAAPRRRP